jgi:hypothetical protein
MTEPHYWLSIQDAPAHVREAAAIAVMESGRARARLYFGPDGELYALWNGGDVGAPADYWVRLPNIPPRNTV